jgi:hypothetical protein
MNKDWTEIELVVESKTLKEQLTLECKARGYGHFNFIKTVQYPFLMISGVYGIKHFFDH